MMTGRWQPWMSLVVFVSWLASSACITHYRIAPSDARRARRQLSEQGLDEVTVRAVRVRDAQPVFIRLRPSDWLWTDDDSQESFRFSEIGVNDDQPDAGDGDGEAPVRPQLMFRHSQSVPLAVLSGGAGLCAATLLVRTTIHLASDKPGTGKKLLIPIYGPASFVDRYKYEGLAGLYAGDFGDFFAVTGMLLLAILDGVSIAALFTGVGLVKAPVEVSAPATAGSPPPMSWSLTPSANGAMFTLRF